MTKLMFLTVVLGQLACPDGKCPNQPPGVEWRSRAEEPDRAYLFVAGRQLGGYDRSANEWRDFDPDTGAWSQPRPLVSKRHATAVQDFGVMREQLAANEERHWLNGGAVSGREARAAIGGLDDDSGKLRLTIIGSETERRAVLNDLETDPELSPLRDQLLVQSYPPDHWTVAGAGFVRSGKPTIYLQLPDGVVRHRQDEYRGPAKLAEAIRRANPHYRPENDPDLNRPIVLPRFHFPRMPGWGWAVAGILLLVVISNRRRTP
jgi:hypothetical protein